jgi:hypothetical protein
MDKFEIRFKFDGELIDGNLIDASDGASFHDAARQLLALHAHFYVNGAVPNAAVGHTKQYRVLEGPARAGCIEFSYVVSLFVKGVIVGAGSAIGKKAVDVLFGDFLETSLKNIFNPKPSVPPFSIEREPMLEALSGNRQPIIDLENDDIAHWQELKVRATTAAIGIMRPVGRCADKLIVLPGSASRIVFGARELKQLRTNQAHYREQQISIAVERIKYSQAQVRLT